MAHQHIKGHVLSKKKRGVEWTEAARGWGVAPSPEKFFLNFQVQKRRVLCIFIAKKLLVARY